MPVFEARAKLQQLRVIGDGTHARVTLELQGGQFSGVWFGMRQSVESPIPFNAGDLVKVAYALKLNDFNNVQKCELQIAAMQKITS